MIIKMLSTLGLVLLSGCIHFSEQGKTNAQQWRYATDPHGSKAIINEALVTEGQVEISFNRVPRIDSKHNSWVELIYDLPGGSLQGAESITLTYQSDKPVIIKLSQKEFGGSGDKSYAHYQFTLPSSLESNTETVMLSNFDRPSWTPSWSQDTGLIKANISALYFVPDLTDKYGGTAKIVIQSLAVQ